MVLKNKVLFSIPSAQLSEQIVSRRKAKEKLPMYYNTAGIIYPPPQNLEQSSSQITALFKSGVMREQAGHDHLTCADLTGGFGVDTFFFSKTVGNMHYVEPETSLLEVARHNHELLGAGNVTYHAATAEAFLETFDHSLDFIYVDPSRRQETGQKVHAFADSQPDIAKLAKKIFGKTHMMLLKASPLLDIQAGIAQLEGVKKVFVVAVRNECKEVLFLCEKGFSGVPAIRAVNIRPEGNNSEFEFTFHDEHDQKVVFSDPLRYLFEPNAAILKAGAFKSVAARFNLAKISVNTHLYTADERVAGFPGKTFEIEKHVKPQPRAVRDSFPDGKANVTTRNYPLSPEALKRKTALKDGGDKFLIGFSAERSRFLVVANRL